MASAVLAPEYQQLLEVLAVSQAADGMRVKQLAAALGWETTPAKMEGVRSRMKRLVARGWVAEPHPGVFTAITGTPAGVRNASRRRPTRWPLISMVMDHSTIASCMVGRLS
jgi:hypothetical protein